MVRTVKAGTAEGSEHWRFSIRDDLGVVKFERQRARCALETGQVPIANIDALIARIPVGASVFIVGKGAMSGAEAIERLRTARRLFMGR